MHNIIKSRDKRLKQILSNTDIVDDLELLKSCSLDDPKNTESERAPWYRFSNMHWSVQLYIKRSIAIYNRIDFGNISILSLEKLYNNGMIDKLPNLTPNGILLPKKETMNEYYNIHKNVVKVISNLGINKSIKTIHYPVTIRISGGFFSQKDERPRASSKIHTDVWSGEPTNTTMVFLPIHGDFKKAGIDFYKTPIDIQNWLRPLNDYNEGKSITDIASEHRYGVVLERNRLYLSDPLLLHSTHKEHKAQDKIQSTPFRISIDFRFISNIECPCDQNDNLRERSYVDYNTWADIGNGVKMTTKDSIFDTVSSDNKQPTNAYSGYYELGNKNAN